MAIMVTQSFRQWQRLVGRAARRSWYTISASSREDAGAASWRGCPSSACTRRAASLSISSVCSSVAAATALAPAVPTTSIGEVASAPDMPAGRGGRRKERVDGERAEERRRGALLGGRFCPGGDVRTSTSRRRRCPTPAFRRSAAAARAGGFLSGGRAPRWARRARRGEKGVKRAQLKVCVCTPWV